EIPNETPPGAEPFDDGTLPSFFQENGVAQNAAQPCYLDSGLPPRDPAAHCAKRAQPAFNGRQSYFSSGVIPYQGLNGNTYDLKLASDIKPGRYRYYCSVHSPLMSGIIDVVAKGTKIASKGEVERQAQREIDKAIAPAAKVVSKVRAGNGPIKGNLAGAGDQSLGTVSINEFFPKAISSKVNQKVMWTMVGHHTISFNAPKYFPIATFAKDGTVVVNEKLDQPAGWTIEAVPGSENGPPPPSRTVDVGPWDGRGFHSTGTVLNDGDKFSLTFTKPGTYLYACLIHPPMVGKLVVK
ncbi:MAG: hypothetical protein QOG03_1035, partial [Actinomycetota bacterium]|nr:hypothetical protein [Actinomycetota bacterium]